MLTTFSILTPITQAPSHQMTPHPTKLRPPGIQLPPYRVTRLHPSLSSHSCCLFIFSHSWEGGTFCAGSSPLLGSVCNALPFLFHPSLAYSAFAFLLTHLPLVNKHAPASTNISMNIHASPSSRRILSHLLCICMSGKSPLHFKPPSIKLWIISLFQNPVLRLLDNNWSPIFPSKKVGTLDYTSPFLPHDQWITKYWFYLLNIFKSHSSFSVPDVIFCV